LRESRYFGDIKFEVRTGVLEMKKIALALAALAALTGTASAADLAARPYTKAPVAMAPVASWTGFWISGGFGYGMGQYQSSVFNPVAGGPTPVFDVGHDAGMKGYLGKVGLGYDYQFGGSWVLGAFADATWGNVSGRNSFTCPGFCTGPTQGYFGAVKNDWSWAAGARIGYVALPGLLTYFNGGFTEANLKGTTYLSTLDGTVGPTIGNRRLNGYFIGGGTEYAVTQIPGLFWKNEVRFSDFGNRTDTNICSGPACGPPFGVAHSLDRNHLYEQAATTELVYRFNWGGPLVAKY
jgi:outer membrane immunogenic protein